MTLIQILTWFGDVFFHHGAHKAALMSVGPHLGWLQSKHWLVKVCWRGTAGCHI